MIVNLAYFLAAILVLTAPLPLLGPVSGFCLGTLLLTTVGLRYGNLHYPRWILVLLVILAQSTALMVWGSAMDLPMGSLLLLLALLLFLIGSAWSSYASLLSAVAVALPLCAVTMQWCASWMGGSSIEGARLALLCLVSWPLIALFARGGLWVMAAIFGCIGVISAMYAVVDTVDGRTLAVLGDVLIDGWRYSDPYLVSGQLVLTLIAVMPLMMESTRLWRTLSVVGVALASVPPVMALLSGPWPQAWPWVVWVCVLPGVLLIIASGIGMLCTVRRPDLLATTAVRALALGVGASAVLLLPLALQAPDEGSLIRALSRAIAPLVWGVAQAFVLVIAAGVAQQRDAPMINTEVILRSRHQAAMAMRTSFSGYFSDVMDSLRKDRRDWLTPSAIVPLIIFLSAGSAWGLCTPWHALPAICVLASLFLRDLARRHLASWTLVQAMLMGICLWALGVRWPMLLGLIGIGVPLVRLFVGRTPDYVAWALPASLGVVVVVWLPWASVRPEPVVISMGQMLLIANAFLHGPVRWIAVPVGAVAGLSFLWWHTPQLDRYVTSVYDTLTLSNEMMDVMARVPLLVLILLVLLISRRRARYGTESLTAQWRLPVFIVSMCAAAIWALGLRPGTGIGLTIGLAVAALLVQVQPVVSRGNSSDLRWPMLDGAGLMLATILIATAAIGASYDAHMAKNEALAGALGSYMLEAGRDVLAILVAMAVVALVQYWPDVVARASALLERWSPSRNRAAGR